MWEEPLISYEVWPFSSDGCLIENWEYVAEVKMQLLDNVFHWFCQDKGE